MSDLTLERRTQDDHTGVAGPVLITPPITEDYWSYRVIVSVEPYQAVVGFPKFGTIGVGFAVEDDWNTNLPYTCGAVEIADHIWHNRLPMDIDRATVVRAIGMVCAAAWADKEATR